MFQDSTVCPVDIVLSHCLSKPIRLCEDGWVRPVDSACHMVARFREKLFWNPWKWLTSSQIKLENFPFSYNKFNHRLLRPHLKAQKTNEHTQTSHEGVTLRFSLLKQILSSMLLPLLKKKKNLNVHHFKFNSPIYRVKLFSMLRLLLLLLLPNIK